MSDLTSPISPRLSLSSDEFIDFDGGEEFSRVWRDGLTPDPSLTVSQWADQHRMLSARASAEPGRYRTDRTPFLPLMLLHDVLIALKIGRHYKGDFTLTKAGQSLIGHPGKIFGIVAPLILFHVDHGSMGRDDKRLAGNWEIFLNVLNVEAHNAVTGEEIRKILYGDSEPDAPYNHIMGHLYIEVLRPLCWMGLLQEYRTTQYFTAEDTIFTKTPLWKAALRLSTDDVVSTATRH
jgi:hypothetical protein